jgi:mono/diheme cytochrome c family protein/plastocyanin
MKWVEYGARGVVVLILMVLPMGIILNRYGAPWGAWAASAAGPVKIIDLIARRPDEGGWSPERITVNKGDRVRLRITGMDVVHGFAIGRLGIDAGRILPGAPVTVEFTADQAGRFTYYCDQWCSPYHYRMRGTLDVIDATAPATAPLTVAEKTQAEGPPVAMDIDGPHEARFYPAVRPSAARGQDLAVLIGLHGLPEVGDLRRQTPESVFKTLRAGETTGPRSDEELWDLIAFLWSSHTAVERLAQGQALFAKNCSGCHGETGAGNGPGSAALPHKPADFTDARNMVGGSSERYYAKIRRGGMGTGMPYWGTIFTEDETWSLVEFLWTFSLNRE